MTRLVCENHPTKAWPEECDCGPGMNDPVPAMAEAIDDAFCTSKPRSAAAIAAAEAALAAYLKAVGSPPDLASPSQPVDLTQPIEFYTPWDNGS